MSGIEFRVFMRSSTLNLKHHVDHVIGSQPETFHRRRLIPRCLYRHYAE